MTVALVDRINELRTDDRVHYHQWAVGDVVVWDNRRLMHATEFDLQIRAESAYLAGRRRNRTRRKLPLVHRSVLVTPIRNSKFSL